MAYAASSCILVLLPGSAKFTFSNARSFLNVISASLVARSSWWCPTGFTLTSYKQLNWSIASFLISLRRTLFAISLNELRLAMYHRNINVFICSGTLWLLPSSAANTICPSLSFRVSNWSPVRRMWLLSVTSSIAISSEHATPDLTTDWGSFSWLISACSRLKTTKMASSIFLYDN